MPSDLIPPQSRAACAPSRQRGPWLRLVSQVLTVAGEHAQFISHAERAWTSNLFTGARHHIVMAFEQVPGILAGEDFIERIAEHEFSISGQIVTDAMVISIHHEALPIPRLTVEAEFLLIQEE